MAIVLAVYSTSTTAPHEEEVTQTRLTARDSKRDQEDELGAFKVSASSNLARPTNHDSEFNLMHF